MATVIDLRLGVLPEGARISAAQWTCGHRVGETSLLLAHGGLLAIKLRSQSTERFRLTIDVQLAALPALGAPSSVVIPGLVLVDSAGRPHTPLAQHSSKHDQAELCLKPSRWHRVTITADGSPHCGSAPYVALWLDGVLALSAERSSASTPFGEDGRSLTILGDSAAVLVRYLEFVGASVPMDAIEQRKQLNIDGGRSFDLQEASDTLALTGLAQRRLCLAPVFRTKIPPIWRSPAFQAEFCDPFLQQTGLDLVRIDMPNPPLLAWILS